MCAVFFRASDGEVDGFRGILYRQGKTIFGKSKPSMRDMVRADILYGR